MKKLNVRILALVLVTLSLIILLSFLYRWGMYMLEGRTRTFLQSLEFVIQTMTTVGYGQDAPWSSSWMIALVIFTEISGVGLILISFPIVVGPWIKERFQVNPPVQYRGPGEHIVLSRHTQMTDSLMDLIAERDRSYVLIEPDRETVTNLYHDNKKVIHGAPDEPEVLKKARVSEASLVILDGTDQFSATASLVLQDVNPGIRVLAISRERKRSEHLRTAGIDKVFYPREIIGETLAHKILSALGKHVDVQPELEDHLEIEELPVFSNSSLIGQTLEEASIRQKTGAYVIGIWRDGQFQSSPEPDIRIQEHDILVAAGTRSDLESLSEQTEIETARMSEEEVRVLIIGYGNEGEAARETLLEHGVDPTVVNDLEREHVDIVGDGMDPDVLHEAGIEDASFLLVTVSDDDVAIMVTIIARKLNPSLEILTQVNEGPAAESMYRAGANYVQALDHVCSQLIAGEALGENLLTYRLDITIQKVDPGDLVGKTLQSMGKHSDKTLIVLAIKRNGTMHTSLSPEFRVEENDELFVVGTENEVEQFREAVKG